MHPSFHDLGTDLQEYHFFFLKNTDSGVRGQGLKSTLDLKEKSPCHKAVVAHCLTVLLLHGSQLFASLSNPKHGHLGWKSHLSVPQGQA